MKTTIEAMADAVMERSSPDGGYQKAFEIAQWHYDNMSNSELADLIKANNVFDTICYHEDDYFYIEEDENENS